jgi:hypothetical protein
MSLLAGDLRDVLPTDQVLGGVGTGSGRIGNAALLRSADHGAGYPQDRHHQTRNVFPRTTARCPSFMGLTSLTNVSVRGRCA